MSYQVDTKEDPIFQELVDWIDVYNIASVLLDAIHEEWGDSFTLEYAKQVWLRCCDTMYEWIEEAVRYSPDPAEE